MKRIATVLAVALLLVVPVASATVINFGSDLFGEGNNLTPGNIVITPHPVWAVPPPGVGWVSYANTGMGPGSFSPPNTTIPGPATAVFWESVFLPYGTNTGYITVFGDDTVGAWLNGLLLKAPNPVQDAYCAAGAIACEAHEGWTGVLDGLVVAGVNTFQFDVYQRGAGPFGVMYHGSIDSVPEPASVSMGLIGFSLIVIGSVFRRKWRRQ